MNEHSLADRMIATGRRTVFIFLALAGGSLMAISACKTGGSKVAGSDTLDVSATPAASSQAAIAIKIIGKNDGNGADTGTCTGSCHVHTINRDVVAAWAKNTQDTHRKCFAAGISPKASAECLQNADLGFYRAGAGLSEIRKLFEQAYGAGWQAQHKEFYENAIMPADRHEMTETDYNTVKTWMLATDGEPQGLAQIFGTAGEGDGPLSQCTDDNSPRLVDYLKARSKNNWTMRLVQDPNYEPFGCPVDQFKQKFASDPIAAAQLCFKSTHRVGSKDVLDFPLAKDMGLNWAPLPNAVHPLADQGWVSLANETHVLKKLPYKTFYWMRSSVDGRFVGNGMQTDVASCGTDANDKPHAVIEDLKAPKDANGTLRERIYVNGRYDPGFFPNNAGFTMHGVRIPGNESDNAAFCHMGLLTSKPYQSCVNFLTNPKAKQYCSVNSLNVYQHVGVSLEGEDPFVVRGTYENDNGAFGRTSDAPTGKFASATSHVDIFKLNRDTYKADQASSWTINKAYNGDWSISPSSQLLISRVSGPESLATEKQTTQGYNIQEMLFENGKPKLNDVGRVCLKGAKASMSSDERILATHHYVDATDKLELGKDEMTDIDFNATYSAKSSNIYLKDLCTGRKARITNMGPKQFALFPHFRADGWLYYLVRDMSNAPTSVSEYVVATDAGLEMQKSGSCGG